MSSMFALWQVIAVAVTFAGTLDMCQASSLLRDVKHSELDAGLQSKFMRKERRTSSWQRSVQGPLQPSMSTSGWPAIAQGDECLLVVVSGPQYETLFETTGPTLRSYAKKHGYKVLDIHLGWNAPTKGHGYASIVDSMWEGASVGFQRGCGWVVMMDADSVIVNQSAPLTSMFDHKDRDLVFPIDARGGKLRGGFRAMRNSRLSEMWIEKVRQAIVSVDANNTCPDGTASLAEGLEQNALECARSHRFSPHVQYVPSTWCTIRWIPGASMCGAIYYGDHMPVAQLWGCPIEEKLWRLRKLHPCQNVEYNDTFSVRTCSSCWLPGDGPP